MTSRSSQALVTIAIAIAAIAIAIWYRQDLAVQNTHTLLIEATLVRIASILKDNEVLIGELQAPPFAEKDSGILSAYLAKIRRDGVAKHPDMKQKLDQLAENNTAIDTLIRAYAPEAKSVAYKDEAEKFQHYAAAWRDRWNSVMDLFMAGGNYPTSERPYPSGFPAAVQGEIKAAD